MRERTKRVLIYVVVVLAIIGAMIGVAVVRSPGSSHAEAVVVIAKPPALVFAWVSDPAKRPTWQSGIKESKLLTPPPMGVGSRIGTVVEQNGQTVETVAEVTAYEPDHLLAGRTVTGSYVMTTAYELTPDSAGTRLRVTTDAELKGWLPRMLAGTIQQNAQKKLDNDLKTLKEKVEKAS